MSNIDVAAFRRMADAGLTLIPLEGKAPKLEGWTTRTFINDDTIDQARRHGWNLGVRLTAEHLVLDVDPRNGGTESLARLSQALGIDLPSWTPATRTGSGGLHLWMRKPADMKVAGKIKGYPGIDIKSVGGQVVAPGSIHPDTKKPYVLDDPLDELFSIPDLPPGLSDLIQKHRTSPDRSEAPRDEHRSPEGRSDASGSDLWSMCDDDELADLLEKLDPEDFASNDAWFPILCACHHLTGGSDGGRTVFLEWCARDGAFADRTEEAGTRWDSLDRAKGDATTGRTLLHLLLERGLIEPGFRLRAETEADLAKLTEADSGGGDGDDPDPTGVMAIAGKDALDKPPPNLNDPDLVVEQMARRYIAILNAGKFEIWMRDYDPAFQRQYWQAMSKQSFSDFFMDEKVQVGSKIVTKADLFLGSRKKRKYRGLVFDPRESEASKDKLNIWEGWAVKPAPGDWSLLRELIVDVLCSGIEAQGEYTLNWIANMFQRPWKVAGSSIVFRGAEGTGKGTLGRALMHISGAHGLTVASSSQVTGRFNAHLRNCIFLFSDEVNWHGSKTAEGALKALITEPIIQYEQKGKDPGNAPNIIHVLMASNEDWVIPAGETARRYFVADVDPKRKGDQAFFDGIDAQLKSGGYEAFLHDMLARDLTGWNPGDIPGTQALADQKLLSLAPASKFWRKLLTEGDLTFLMHITGEEMDDWEYLSIDLDSKMKNRLVGAYADFLTRERIAGGNASHKALAAEGKKYGLDPKTRDSRGNRTWWLPALPAMRAAFERHFGAAPGSIFDE